MVHISTSTLLLINIITILFVWFSGWIVGDAANVIGYGHLGDSNLHLNVSVPQYDDKVAQTNSRIVVMKLLFSFYLRLSELMFCRFYSKSSLLYMNGRLSTVEVLARSMVWD
jgi:hypothetical protein